MHRLNEKSTQHAGSVKEGKTAIVTHYEEEGHFPSFEDVVVVEKGRNIRKRLVKETFNIFSHNTFNERRDTDRSSSVYWTLLNG